MQAGWSPLPQEKHSGARLTSSPGAWRYWFYFQRVPKRSGDATSLQPSPARHSGQDPSLLPPQLAEARDGPCGPTGVPGQGASMSSGDVEPLGSSLAVRECGGPSGSLHAQPAPCRTARPAKRQ